MIYTRPSFADLQARIAADLAAMPLALREPLVAAWARACHGLHGHMDWAVLQTSPLTCELERLYDYAALYAVDRLLARPASGNVTVTGSLGATLLSGAVARSNEGVDYVVTAAVTLPASGSALATVRCMANGLTTNLGGGQVLTLTAPAAGIASTLTVVGGGLTGGADDEQVDDWRARVADEWRTLVEDGARGGKLTDYVFWAKAAHPSVTGALVQAHGVGVGSIVVRPICNTLPDRLPTTAVLQAVSSYLATEAPPGDVRVFAPVVHAVHLRILLGASINTQANQTAVNESLIDLINSKADDSAILTLVEIDEAISMVTSQFTLASPTADMASSSGEVFVLREILWS
ncbi:baseplate J/gp47 family protein [Limnohabitans sp.]|uniref:baseplate J/gp47 family protein n=1 Tax=Limnohabitans sp. TaxID=1907725 RepID=UPI00286F2F1D|nr:baseplate J/gp47 family protein [Limnohabitans sp.]